MAASYFRVSSKLWAEPWDHTTLFLAFYLLTCPHRLTEGLYKLPLGYVQGDLGWSAKKVGTHLKVLIDAGFCEYDRETGVVLLPKALKYQSPQNPNQAVAALAALETVPPSVLDKKFGRLAQLFAQRLWEVLPERFRESPSPSPALTPPTPPEGGRRANGTNPRAAAKKSEIDRLKSLMTDCPECGDKPNVLCGTCTGLNRKISELVNA